MNVQAEKPEKIWHLEMLHPEELCSKALPPKTQLIRQEIPLPTMNRFFYHEVGMLWHWTDRISWSEEQWRSWVEREELQTLDATFSRHPCRLF